MVFSSAVVRDDSFFFEFVLPRFVTGGGCTVVSCIASVMTISELMGGMHAISWTTDTR